VKITIKSMVSYGPCGPVVLIGPCPAGTPAGPDPDRAEMLLAEALAVTLAKTNGWHPSPGNAGAFAEVVSNSERDVQIGGDWSAAYNGAHEQWHGDGSCVVCGGGDEGNPDAFAAGAALCMAMEGA
jgi:hypothetical protein